MLPIKSKVKDLSKLVSQAMENDDLRDPEKITKMAQDVKVQGKANVIMIQNINSKQVIVNLDKALTLIEEIKQEVDAYDTLEGACQKFCEILADRGVVVEEALNLIQKVYMLEVASRCSKISQAASPLDVSKECIKYWVNQSELEDYRKGNLTKALTHKKNRRSKGTRFRHERKGK